MPTPSQTCGAPQANARRVALALLVASGFAGLGYQIVWTQQSALWLGHEAAAVLAVVAAFFGGIAAGALLLGPGIDRSARPARWYAGCEALIGAWSLVLALSLGPLSAALLDLIGPQPSAARHWLVAFCGTFVVLLPATAAMGATLPAMERALASLRGGGASIAVLYAGNTLGAVLGVLACAFVLVPELGLVRTAAVCAALNLFCAGAAARVFAGAAIGTAAAPRAPLPPPASTVLPLLATTGLLGIGFEVLVVRVVSQVAENTVYTFAILLATYLVGTTLGAAAYARRPARSTDATALLLLAAVACLLGTLSLAAAEPLHAAVLRALGPGMAAALAAEAAVAAAAFLLPTIAMGALFSHLGARAAAAGIGFGRALGINTLGAAFAPFVFGVWLLPAVGAKLALLLVSAGYAALAARRARRGPALWLTAGATAVAAFAAPSLAIVDVPDGGRVVSYEEGVMAAVSVVEDADGVARLRIDNRQQEGSSATGLADARQALLPILLHPRPRRALFLGLGTGVTAAAAAADPQLDVDAVELLPEVVAASAYFTAGAERRPRLLIADARRYARASREHYDVIVADNFHPARSGSGSLYTVEHFAAVRERLADGGLFCQWLPLHQLDLDTVRSIARSFLAVHPHAFALLATHSLDTPVLGLVARRDGETLDLAAVRARLLGAAPALHASALGVGDELALLGTFVAGPRALERFAAGAPLNTDDRPVVAYGAPRITYAPDSLPRDRLIALLHEVEIDPSELLASAADEPWSARLAAYWAARDRFIEAGRDVHPAADVRQMLAQVRVPLLDVLRISPDFGPAYEPLLRMAHDLERYDAAAASALLAELERARAPAIGRPQAGPGLAGGYPSQ